jgi:hypothetical protein
MGLTREAALTLAANSLRFSQAAAGNRPASWRIEGSRDVAGRNDHCRTACVEERAFRGAVIDAVERATLRSRELGR